MTQEENKLIKSYKPILLAMLAAFVYGASAPVSKILLDSLPPIFLAGLLYFGAGTGMILLGFAKREINNRKIRKAEMKSNEGSSVKSAEKEARLGREDLVWVIGMIALDVVAPIFLLLGLSRISPANASLLFNFEIVTTTIVASVFFKEAIGKRLLLAIGIITTASVILSVEDFSAFNFSIGSILVLGACIAWGFENNCTRNISGKSPEQIVILKGIFAGTTSLVIGLLTEKVIFLPAPIFGALLTGFLGYGLSVYFYVKAQRDLGAARTSTYYAVAPFAGVIFSFLIYRTGIDLKFCIAFALMTVGAYLAVSEIHKHKHLHEKIQHEHSHTHDDLHHEGHFHEESERPKDSRTPHSHMHTHEAGYHVHKHTPDIHHRHGHDHGHNHENESHSER